MYAFGWECVGQVGGRSLTTGNHHDGAHHGDRSACVLLLWLHAGPSKLVARSQDTKPVLGVCGNVACLSGAHDADWCTSTTCPLSAERHLAVEEGCTSCREHVLSGSRSSWRAMRTNVLNFIGLDETTAAPFQLRVSTAFVCFSVSMVTCLGCKSMSRRIDAGLRKQTRHSCHPSALAQGRAGGHWARCPRVNIRNRLSTMSSCHVHERRLCRERRGSDVV